MRGRQPTQTANQSPVTCSAWTFSFVSYRLRDLLGLFCFEKTKVVWGGRVWKYSSSSTSVSSSSKRTRRWWCRELRTRSSDLPGIIFCRKLNINENKLCSDAFNILPDDFKIYYHPVNIMGSLYKRKLISSPDGYYVLKVMFKIHSLAIFRHFLYFENCQAQGQ